MEIDRFRDEDSELDVLLATRVPGVGRSDSAPGAVFDSMIEDARAASRRRRPAAARTVGVILVSSAVVAGGALGAAATYSWAPWAEDPDGAFVYSLPSGAQCEARVGVSPYASEDAAREAGNVLESLAWADVQPRVVSAIASSRPDETWTVDERGQQVPGGSGTEHWSEDREFEWAVGLVVIDLVHHELEASGVPVEEIHSVEIETHCPGADW